MKKEEVKLGLGWGRVGGGMFITIREQSYTAFFCNFFFMQKSCGQFVDVSDLNLVVCYII